MVLVNIAAVGIVAGFGTYLCFKWVEGARTRAARWMRQSYLNEARECTMRAEWCAREAKRWED